MHDPSVGAILHFANARKLGLMAQEVNPLESIAWNFGSRKERLRRNLLNGVGVAVVVFFRGMSVQHLVQSTQNMVDSSALGVWYLDSPDQVGDNDGELRSGRVASSFVESVDGSGVCESHLGYRTSKIKIDYRPRCSDKQWVNSRSTANALRARWRCR